MKAIYQEEYGTTNFKLGELPKPAPSDGEVLIKVHAASVNPLDIKRHLIMKDEKFPMLAGYDVAGVIEELGGGDTGTLKVGDRVFGEVMGTISAPKTTGAFAEYTVVNASNLALIPKDSSFETMAATPIAIGTCFLACDELGVGKGTKIFISGGAGGVGIHAVQIAKKVFGAAEVATTAREAKKAFVKQHDVDIIVDYKKEDAGDVLKGWADVAFDCTGEPDMAVKIVKEGGKIVSIVDMANPAAKFLIIVSGSKLMGRIAEAVSEGKLKVEIDTVYSLDDGLKAIQHVLDGRAKGKVVIKVI